MKKYIIAFSIILTSIFGFGFGLEMIGGENPNITQEVNSNLYLAGGNVNVNSQINGDLTTAGGQINVNSNIQRDLITVGGTIRVMGNIGGNAKIAGGDILINGEIKGDLVVAGGTVTLSQNSVIQGDLVVEGGNVNLYGKIEGKGIVNGGETYVDAQIKGNLDINSEKIMVGNNAKIGGNLNYKSKIQNQPLESIAVGKKTFQKLESGDKNINGMKKGFLNDFVYYMMIGFIIFGLIFFFLGKKLFLSIGEIVNENFWKSIGLGVLYYILMPILAILLMFTIIGIPLGFFAIFVYIFSFIFSGFINVLVFSGWTINKFFGGKNAKFRQIRTGVIINAIIFSIIGPFNIIISFLSFGAILQKKLQIWQQINN